MNEVKSDIKAAKKVCLPWWGVLCLLIGGMPLPWLLERFGRPNLMMPMWNSVAVLALIFALKRGLYRQTWFWLTMAVIAVLHVALVLFVPWTRLWVPALVIACIDSVDFCMMLWTLSVVRRLAGGR